MYGYVWDHNSLNCCSKWSTYVVTVEYLLLRFLYWVLSFILIYIWMLHTTRDRERENDNKSCYKIISGTFFLRLFVLWNYVHWNASCNPLKFSSSCIQNNRNATPNYNLNVRFSVYKPSNVLTVIKCMVQWITNRKW